MCETSLYDNRCKGSQAAKEGKKTVLFENEKRVLDPLMRNDYPARAILYFIILYFIVYKQCRERCAAVDNIVV